MEKADEPNNRLIAYCPCPGDLGQQLYRCHGAFAAWLSADCVAAACLAGGLILLLVVRQLPQSGWWGKVLILGALNFAIFWSMLFLAAYRLPGGVAATLGAVQPLFVLFLARFALGSTIKLAGIIAAISGIFGVALLVLDPGATLDPVGIASATIGALSMAAGTVLTRKWQPPVSPLTFTAWQLTAGGVLLIPVALILEPSFPVPTLENLAGLAWLGLIGAALTYYLWFRGIAKLGPATVTSFGFLSPTSAVLLGWIILGEQLSPTQIAGVVIVLTSIWLGQRAARPAPVAAHIVPPVKPAANS